MHKSEKVVIWFAFLLQHNHPQRCPVNPISEEHRPVGQRRLTAVPWTMPTSPPTNGPPPPHIALLLPPGPTLPVKSGLPCLTLWIPLLSIGTGKLSIETHLDIFATQFIFWFISGLFSGFVSLFLFFFYLWKFFSQTSKPVEPKASKGVEPKSSKPVEPKSSKPVEPKSSKPVETKRTSKSFERQNSNERR